MSYFPEKSNTCSSPPTYKASTYIKCEPFPVKCPKCKKMFMPDNHFTRNYECLNFCNDCYVKEEEKNWKKRINAYENMGIIDPYYMEKEYFKSYIESDKVHNRFEIIDLDD